MTLTLAHVFIAVAVLDLVVIFMVTARWRREDERLPEEKRRPARLVLGAAILASAALVAVALLHPIGELRIG
jgi:membrane-anchored protein YejM (alkaline phosphatase superfamily)